MTPALVVLAGGGSRRFGADKTAVVVDGRTLLEHAVRALDDARVVVVGRARPMSREVTWTCEEPAGAGPAAALQAGLAEVPDGPVLVLAADLPRAADLARTLVAAAAAHPDHPTVVAVDASGRPQWTSTLLSAIDAHSLRTAPPAVDASLHSLVDPLDWRPVAVADTTAHDVDTPADLAQEGR